MIHNSSLFLFIWIIQSSVFFLLVPNYHLHLNQPNTLHSSSSPCYFMNTSENYKTEHENRQDMMKSADTIPKSADTIPRITIFIANSNNSDRSLLHPSESSKYLHFLPLLLLLLLLLLLPLLLPTTTALPAPPRNVYL